MLVYFGMAKQTRRSQNVVIELNHDEWWIMHNDGSVEVKVTAEEALGTVQRAAHRRNPGVTVTKIEWRGVPDGWQPPTVGR